MKNWLIFILAGVFLHSHIDSFAQPRNGQETLHSNVNFINIHNKSFSLWYGPDPVSTKHQFLQFEYENHQHGWARIKFYAKDVKTMATLDSIYKTKKQDTDVELFAMNNLNKFEIWMTFVDKRYDKDEPDAGDTTTYVPHCPCKLELYKLVNNGWLFVKSAQIPKDGNELGLFP
ncbi:hypothetical protein [Mucilaginibacter flavidus]|uniref:hypothetical protein n=1 Tax=Mucilaginibacter flavidus TaxID=2949309 RepID=UPI0020932760|nr:hypothetical protein [Mucilaginibacter flavidus]MCO5950602.1 hypothetical protein [Mucilaginibacter flavidus]